MSGPLALTPLEIAAGIPLTRGRRRSTLPPATGEPSLVAFRAAVLEALARPPCLVSFSGGRDSSAVLAVAAEAARAEGLPLPVPATTRFAGAEETVEHEWQERVVAHLGLDEWERLEIGEEFDCVGPVAARVLRRHGVLWPPNTHFHEPLLARAAGGSLLSGVGGDEMFSTPRFARAADVIGGRVRPGPRDAAWLALAVAPPRLRRLVFARGADPGLPWLTPAARRTVTAALVAEAAREPFAWRRRFRWLAGLAYVRVGTASLALLATDHDVSIAHPFLSEPFLAAVAAGPRFRNREEGMRLLFSQHLPESVLARRDKARFGAALTGAPSRAFATSWNGRGVDTELVETETLRRLWHEGALEGTETLLQQLWLERDRSRSPDDVGDRVDGSGE